MVALIYLAGPSAGFIYGEGGGGGSIPSFLIFRSTN